MKYEIEFESVKIVWWGKDLIIHLLMKKIRRWPVKCASWIWSTCNHIFVEFTSKDPFTRDDDRSVEVVAYTYMYIFQIPTYDHYRCLRRSKKR
mmetsp:Transcript_32633/g.79409  ORF Transcript_32633/g.79409 Transcript_32633/m.79409 type:complete len:93 (-) Transcript_32633:44-322(-)